MCSSNVKAFGHPLKLEGDSGLSGALKIQVFVYQYLAVPGLGFRV